MSEQINSTDTRSKSNVRLYVILILLAFVIASPIAALIMVGVGQVRGVEFSPDDFSRRSFSYNQLPVVDYVLFKKTYEDETPDLEIYLVGNGLIRPVLNKKKNWHLVDEAGVQVQSTDSDARFLTGYLDKRDDDGANYWDTWNTDFPKSAKVFWPYVADLARDEMYLKVADVMRTAMSINKDQPTKLDVRLKEAMAKVYLELGSIDFEIGRTERAEFRLTRSLEFLPSQQAFTQRAKVFDELGDADKANQDRSKAKSVDKITLDNDDSDTDKSLGDK